MNTKHTVVNYANQLIFCELRIGDVFINATGTQTLLRVLKTKTATGQVFNSVIMSTGAFVFCQDEDPVTLTTEVRVFL